MQEAHEADTFSNDLDPVLEDATCQMPAVTVSTEGVVPDADTTHDFAQWGMGSQIPGSAADLDKIKLLKDQCRPPSESAVQIMTLLLEGPACASS